MDLSRRGTYLDYHRETLILLVVLTVAALAGFSPIPELGFALQMMGVGTGIGMAVAYYLDRQRPDAERWRHVLAGFTVGGLAFGLLLVAGDALLSLL